MVMSQLLSTWCQLFWGKLLQAPLGPDNSCTVICMASLSFHMYVSTCPYSGMSLFNITA